MYPFFLAIPIIPFLDFNNKQIITISTILLIIGEVLFWSGGLLAGKELLTKYKFYFNPKNWFKKKTAKTENQMSKNHLDYVIILLILCCSCSEYSIEKNKENEPTTYNISIPTEGNSWLISGVHQTSEIITSEGLQHWTNADQIIRTYFYVEQSGKISLGLRAKVKFGESVELKDLSLFMRKLKHEFKTLRWFLYSIDPIKMENWRFISIFKITYQKIKIYILNMNYLIMIN